ncbi:MAG: hypothetical protein AAF211_29620, partial [Myxococcota bacterium]
MARPTPNVPEPEITAPPDPEPGPTARVTLHLSQLDVSEDAVLVMVADVDGTHLATLVPDEPVLVLDDVPSGGFVSQALRTTSEGRPALWVDTRGGVNDGDALWFAYADGNPFVRIGQATLDLASKPQGYLTMVYSRCSFASVRGLPPDPVELALSPFCLEPGPLDFVAEARAKGRVDAFIPLLDVPVEGAEPSLAARATFGEWIWDPGRVLVDYQHRGDALNVSLGGQVGRDGVAMGSKQFALFGDDRQAMRHGEMLQGSFAADDEVYDTLWVEVSAFRPERRGFGFLHTPVPAVPRGESVTVQLSGDDMPEPPDGWTFEVPALRGRVPMPEAWCDGQPANLVRVSSLSRRFGQVDPARWTLTAPHATEV